MESVLASDSDSDWDSDSAEQRPQGAGPAQEIQISEGILQSPALSQDSAKSKTPQNRTNCPEDGCL
jgi:hypothetical protein